MSLIEFDTLRERHPEQQDLLGSLEREILRILRQDPKALLDDVHLEARTDSDALLVKHVLIELVQLRALRPRFLWQCSLGLGTSIEADAVRDLPDSIECDRCGQRHEFSAENVEVNYLPTESLLAEVLSRSPR